MKNGLQVALFHWFSLNTERG